MKYHQFRANAITPRDIKPITLGFSPLGKSMFESIKTALMIHMTAVNVTAESSNQRPILSPTQAHTENAITATYSPTDNMVAGNDISLSEFRTNRTNVSNGINPTTKKSQTVIKYKPRGRSIRFFQVVVAASCISEEVCPTLGFSGATRTQAS